MNDIHRDQRNWRVLALAAAANFLTILDHWVVSIGYTAFERVFAPAKLSDVAWILNAYALVLASLLIPSGRIADDLGRKTWFLLGLLLFGAGSLGCGAAPTLPVLVAWRAVQGAAAAMLMPTALGFAISAFPASDRAAAIGIWAAVGAAAAGSGPLIGGLLLTVSWRWMFLINVPLVLAAVALGLRHLPRSARRVHGRIDWVGALLVFVTTALMCIALGQAGTWSLARIASTFGVGLCVGAALVVHVRRHADPIVAPRLLALPRLRFGALAIFTYYVGFACMLVGCTLLLTDCWHLSVLQAALAIAPAPCTSSVVSLFSGRLSARLGFRAMFALGASAFAAAGLWPVLAAHAAANYAFGLLPSLVAWGLANALFQPALFATADAAPSDELSSASALLTMARQLGSAVGLALLVAVLENQHAPGLALLRRAWVVVIIAAAIVAAAGMRATTVSSAAPRIAPRSLSDATS